MIKCAGVINVQGVSLEVILLLLLEMVGLEATVPRASWLPVPELSFAWGVEEGSNEIPLREGLGTTDRG